MAVRQSRKVPHAPGKRAMGVSQTACDPRRPCVWRAGGCIRTSAGKCQLGTGPFQRTLAQIDDDEEDGCAPSQCLGPV